MPDLLERFAPPPTTPSPEAERAARAALLRHAGRRRLPRPAIPVLVALAAAAALFFAWPRGERKDVERSATPRTQTSLLAPSRPLTKGEYLYRRSHGAGLEIVGDKPPYASLVTSKSELWQGLDGTGWLISSHGDRQWLTTRDKQRWIAAGRPALGGKSDSIPLGTDDQGGPTPMTTLPTDPGRLLALLTSNGHGTPQQTFQALGDAFRDGYTTSAQRAALVAVATRIPGVERDDAARDHAGRPGIGFARDDTANHVRDELILEPGSNALEGEQETTLPGYWEPFEPGTTIGWTVIDRVEVVNRIKERP